MTITRLQFHFLRYLFAMLFLGSMLNFSWAAESFIVQDIRIEGLQRVEPGTIFASLPVKVGDSYTDDKAATSIRALFSLGLFKDVRIEVDGKVLVVVVEERPTIGDVDFSGTKEFDKELLQKSLREVGLAEGRPYDRALVDRSEQELKRQYINKGFYASQVITTVTPTERNRVNLSFSVAEGERATIKEIRIVGNKSFSDSVLLGLFDQDTGGWLSWYTKSNQYAKPKLNADIETLRSYYLARGFLEFKVDSTQVVISPDKQGISININITEGGRFVVSKIKLQGNYLDKEKEFQSLIAIKVGEAYNADQVAQTTKAFTENFGNFGFAFARTEVQTVIDRNTNQVELVLQADPGRRAYVRRINVAGNDVSRDEVIRREFRQLEAAWYDGEKIRQSRNRVDRLGYFKEVSLETVEIPGSNDQVDLLITVVEKPTGNVNLGAGISSSDGLGLTFGFRQDNVFGSGNSLGINVNTSKFNRTLDFSTTNPYFTEDGVSRSLNVFQRTVRSFVDTYSTITTGAGISFGIPFTEKDTVFLGASLDQTEIVLGNNLPLVYQDFVNQFGYKAGSLPLTVGWARDTRDSALIPTTGRVLRANAEWSPVGDLRYVRATTQYQQFFPVTKRTNLAFNTELAIGGGLNDLPYPVFKNFSSGGLGSVRGFEQGSLSTGPQREFGLTSTGGAKRFTFNAEILSPLPGAGNDKSLRMYGFWDVGGVYGPDEAIQVADMRSSVGVGLSWISPVGPLRLSFGRAIKKFDSDKTQAIQFNIGTSF